MTELLSAVSIIFITAGVFLLVGNRFDVPTVPLLIIAGLVVGPVVQELFGVTLIEEGLTITLAQIGIALLVFTFGASIQFEEVRTVLGDSEIAALVGVLVVGMLGVGVGSSLGLAPEQALFVGIAAALSSTIVGTSLLQADIRKNLVHGRLAQSIQFVQDLLAIGIVLVLGAGTLAADPIATQLGYGVVLLAAGVFVNQVLFDLMDFMAGGSDEPMIVGVIALLVLFMGAAEFVGVSIVVGSFAAGIAVRRDPAEHIGLLNGLESIKDFFVAIFFVTVGVLVTVPTVEMFVIAAVLVVLTMVVKPAVTIVVLIYEGYEARSATLTGLNLDQISEFAIIIAIEAWLLGILLQSVFDAIILAAAVTMISSSLTRRYDEQLYGVLSRRGLISSRHVKIDQRSDVPDDLDDHVVILGYGRQGHRLAKTCEESDKTYVVIENDPTLLSELERTCEAYVFGNAMERYTWEKARVEDAQLVVSTIESETISQRLLSLANGTDVVLRADDVASAFELYEKGATYVTISDVLAAERLVEHIESIASGEIRPEQLRNGHLAELESQRITGFHTSADEIKRQY